MAIAKTGLWVKRNPALLLEIVIGYNANMADKLRSRYEELKQKIHSHNHRYHVLDAPVISDMEFDKLLNESSASKPTTQIW